MLTRLYATAFRLSDDTESTKETPGIVQFLTDHNIPFTRFSLPDRITSGVTFQAENRVQWHETDCIVELPITTLDQLKQYCAKYSAHFEIHAEYAVIHFD